jgi:MFS family permease
VDRKSWGLFRLSAAFFFIFVGTGALQPFLKVYWQDVWPASARAAWILATVYLSFGVFRFFSAYTVERMGLEASIFLGAAGYVGFAAAVAWIESFPALLAVAAAWGFAASLFWSGSASYVLDASSPGRYGRASQRMYLAARAGVILGVLIHSVLMVHSTRLALPIFAGAAALVGALAVVRLPRPTTHVAPERSDGFWQVARRLLAGEGALVGLFLMAGAAVYGFFLSQFVAFSKKGLGDSWWVMWVNFPFFLSAWAANLWTGSLSDRIGRKWLFLAGFAVGAVGLATLAGAGLILPAATGGAKAGAAALIVVGSILMGLQFAIVPTVAMAWVGDHTSHGDRTRAYGMTFTARDMGVGGSILAAAYLAGAFSLVWTAAAFAAASAVCAGLSLFLRSPER